MSTATDAPVEETLAWEAEKRPRISTIAIVGGLLTVMGNVLFTVISNGGPTEEDGFISLTGALQERLDGQAPEGPSLLVRQFDHLGDNALLLSLSTVLVALAAIALALTVLFLYRAAAARSDQVGRLPYYMAFTGLIMYPLGRGIRDFALWFGAAGFEGDPDRSAGAARDLGRSAPVAAGSLIEFFGTFALAASIVLISIYAMRVGLLTRFFGVLGIITGVLVSGILAVLQADQPGIVRSFWMIGVGLVIAGRLNTPPAWETGRAEPWPSQQELREQRAAAEGTKGDRADRISRPDDEGDAPPTPEHARKKRKRRR